jgi:heme exporter protein A
MQPISLDAIGIVKSFSHRKVLTGISFSVSHSQTLGVVGRNGSGKSTLVKILAGLLSATSGEVRITLGGHVVAHDNLFRNIGFVAPYLQLYDEFSARENLELFKRLRGGEGTDDTIDSLLRRMGLYNRRNDLVRTYSSGMKQRLKYIFALLHQPPLLVLDEPRTNLDAEGIEAVYALVAEQRRRGITIIASNDAEDARLCDNIVDLNAAVTASGKGGEALR